MNNKVNKIFLSLSLLISLAYIFYFNFNDIVRYPAVKQANFDFLKDFKKDYPDIKKVGFCTNEANHIEVLYKIQTSIIPAFIDYSQEEDYLFCYSKNNGCYTLVQNKKAVLLKKYSPEIIFIKKTGSKI